MPRLAVAPRRKLAVAPRKRVPVKVTKAVYVKPARSLKAAAPKVYKNASKSGAFGTAGGLLGTLLGTALGGPGGGMMGGTLGKLGGAALSSIFGHGDYQVTNGPAIKENNLLSNGGNAANIPQFGTGKVACNFKHREYIGDIISSATAGAFKIDSFNVNPGLPTTFPWLSGVVGANFQQYRLNGMAFEFRSMSGDALNSVNTALGSVIMSSDYDSADAAFTSKQQMENTEYGVSCKPSVNMLHAIECARSQTSISELYVRNFGVPTGTDIRLYDMCKFYIASVGCQGTSVNLGELWVTYDVDAFKAIEQAPGYSNPVSEYTLTTVDATHALGASQTTVVEQIGLVLAYVAGTSYINFPLQSMQVGAKYLVTYKIYGSSTASVATCTYVPTGGMVALNANASLLQNPDTATATSAVRAVSEVFTYNGTGTVAVPPQIAITGGVVPTAIIVASLIVVQIGAAFV